MATRNAKPAPKKDASSSSSSSSSNGGSLNNNGVPVSGIGGMNVNITAASTSVPGGATPSINQIWAALGHVNPSELLTQLDKEELTLKNLKAFFSEELERVQLEATLLNSQLAKEMAQPSASTSAGLQSTSSSSSSLNNSGSPASSSSSAATASASASASSSSSATDGGASLMGLLQDMLDDVLSSSSMATTTATPPWSHEGVDDRALISSLSSHVSTIIATLSCAPYNTISIITSLYDCMTDTHSTDITYHSDELVAQQPLSSDGTIPAIDPSTCVAIHKADGWWQADGVPLRAVLPSYIWQGSDGYITVPSLIELIRDYTHSPPPAASSVSSDNIIGEPQWDLPIVPLTEVPHGYVHVQLTVPPSSSSFLSWSESDTDLGAANELSSVVPLTSFTAALASLLAKLREPVHVAA